jgi:uncharacterized protein Veg
MAQLYVKIDMRGNVLAGNKNLIPLYQLDPSKFVIERAGDKGVHQTVTYTLKDKR